MYVLLIKTELEGVGWVTEWSLPFRYPCGKPQAFI